jgi:hypothetical protein
MVTIDIISLDSINTKDQRLSEDYQIKMKCDCSIHSCKDLTCILEEYQLEMKEENNFLILNSKTCTCCFLL